MKKGNSKITTVIFDLGEVYLRGFRGMYKRVAPIVNIDPLEVRKLLSDDKDMTQMFLGDISEKEYWSRVIKRTGWKITIEKMELLVRENFAEIEGTREILESLKDQGYKLGLLSIHTREWIEYSEKKFDYHRLFDSVLYSFDAKALKPEKKVYEMILERLGSKATESVFIDDKPENLVPASDLGIKTILFTDSKKLKIDLESFGIIV